MVQKIKGLAAKLDDLSLLPGTHMMEGESQLYRLYSSLHTCTMACILTVHRNACIIDK